MTWREFKKLVEDAGVNDEDKLLYIITDDNPVTTNLTVCLNEGIYKDEFYVYNS